MDRAASTTQKADNSFRVFTGGVFRFQVAGQANAFVLHADLASRHSPVLHTLMHRRMRESQENWMHLNNVDGDTSTRFSEFIYGGDYNSAAACVVLDDPEVGHPRADDVVPKGELREVPCPFGLPAQPEDLFHKAPETNAEPDAYSGCASKKKHTQGGKIPIWKQPPPLASLADFPLPANTRLLSPKILDTKDRNDSLMYDYTEAFCHIRLYAFAEQYR
ncbi:hypothetical protein LTR55_012062, partial [Exophiala xenobiotica]